MQRSAAGAASGDGIEPSGQASVAALTLRAWDQSAVALLLVGSDRSIVSVNVAACTLVDAPEEVLVGTGVTEVLHADDRDRVTRVFDRVFRGQIDAHRVPARIAARGGAAVHVDLHVSVVRDDHDRRVAAAVVVTPVADADAVRDEIDAARAQLRGVIDSQIDPWIYLEAVRADDGAIVDFAYRDANDAALVANRMPRDELLASTLLSLLPGHATNGLLAQYVAVVETGRALSLDDDPYASELAGGETRWFDNRLVKVGDGLSFTWRDVTDRVLLRQRLAREATSDPLTGLVNRAGFAEAAQRAFARTRRRGEQLAMFYCDVDHLKFINDTYGHEWGDLVLRTIADRLAGTLRTSDVAARIGGDEFVVIADGITDSEAALAVAMKIADAVTRPITHAGRELVPTLSIGLAVALPGETVEDVLRHADEALYRQKRQRDLPATEG